jgi:predicted DNA-binding transcriptional regulator YafY
MTKPTPPASLSDLAKRLTEYAEGKNDLDEYWLTKEEIGAIIAALESQKDIKGQVEAAANDLAQIEINLRKDADRRGYAPEEIHAADWIKNIHTALAKILADSHQGSEQA